MSMAGTEREPESTAPDVSVVTGLIRSGKSSMPKRTIYHRAQSFAFRGRAFRPSARGRGGKTNGIPRKRKGIIRENAKFSILSLSLYVPCWHLSGAIINI